MIPHGGLEIELDVYAGALEGLLVAEVEFATEADAREFEPPEWFGDEVTGRGALQEARRLATTGAARHRAAPRARATRATASKLVGVFDQLSDRLQETLSDVRNRGKLTEADVDKAMREIRLALLEADVNFKVVKQFTAQVKERCLGAGVLETLNPGQQVVKIVNEELAALMGGAEPRPRVRRARGRP